ncbi:MAG: lamin tail domain-containing protein, partial [Chloroflexi bacterium]|nr:lamin tail domain-containing protein [Chloroflexota bacterium]
MLLAVLVAVVLNWAATPAQAVSTTVVISQVYGGGGNTSAIYRNDFIELFNRGTVSQSLNGWSVQYASSTSTNTNFIVTALSNVTLAPGQYYLVQESSGGTVGAVLPAPDATGSINLSATTGKVALVNTTAALVLSGTGCPSFATIVDFIGYGTANCNEGGSNAPAPSNTTAALRIASGCTDTDNNSSDFTAGAPNPRNTMSPLTSCAAPAVLSTSPANGAVNVSPSTSIVLTFTQSVSVTGTWFT